MWVKRRRSCLRVRLFIGILLAMGTVTMQVTFSADQSELSGVDSLKYVLQRFVEHTGLTKVNELTHVFQPQGVSIVFILSESHIALHSWPEEQYAYITISSCRDFSLDVDMCQTIIAEELPSVHAVTVERVGSVVHAAQ